MTLVAAVGQSAALEGREAGARAMRQAVEGVGRAPAAFALVIASHLYSIQDVLNGAAEAVGNLPLLGFSTSGEITTQGRRRRSVTVALLCAEDIHFRAGWFPEFVQDSRGCIQAMLDGLKPETGEHLLVVADGLNGDPALLGRALSGLDLPVAGCLAGGELWRGRTSQIGGRQAGSGGLAAGVLSGNIRVGVGAAHGWQPIGAVAHLTRVQGQWVRSLDGQPAGDTYARLFGYPAREWSHPPLNELVRLYPLALKENGSIQVHSPMRMEADGSLRMNTSLPEGQAVDLMIGSAEGCQQAAETAARQALEDLGAAHPRIALVLVDAAWQTLLELEPQAEVQAIQRVIGQEVPVIGGYTYGQIDRPQVDGPVRVLNQHILVALFGA